MDSVEGGSDNVNGNIKHVQIPNPFSENVNSYTTIGHAPQVANVQPNPQSCSMQNQSYIPMCDANRELYNNKVIEGQNMHHTCIGESPWLTIENRINNIRSAGIQQNIAGPVPEPSNGVKSIYSNYNTEYIDDDSWKIETNQKLSSKILRQHAKAEETVDNVAPRRRPFKSLAEMADSLGSMEPGDQTNMIKLLLSCRKLEKLIEEQQNVLDLLNHDLKEANELLKIPPELRNTVNIGSAPSTKPFYPTSEAPAFIKGRISLLPERYAASKSAGELKPSFANLVAISQNNKGIIQEAK